MVVRTPGVPPSSKIYISSHGHLPSSFDLERRQPPRLPLPGQAWARGRIDTRGAHRQLVRFGYVEKFAYVENRPPRAPQHPSPRPHPPVPAACPLPKGLPSTGESCRDLARPGGVRVPCPAPAPACYHQHPATGRCPQAGAWPPARLGWRAGTHRSTAAPAGGPPPHTEHAGTRGGDPSTLPPSGLPLGPGRHV
jgi:hypothetical protein